MGLFRRRAPALTPAAAHEAAAGGRLLLLDVREPGEYAAGHAPGARSLPLADLPAALEGLRGHETPLAFICQSGMRSGTAAATSRKAGLTIQNVRGGMLAWERAGLPVERS